ncbi:MAG: outer membrane beta-barrel protein [Elusimicrobia bacterium]|nr:outer membrane beta-barrel protein [Elusimicrobiota bacterium]
MKKGLLALLLAVALVAPVFATDKGAMEIDAKLGYIIEPLELETEYGKYKYAYPQESTFSLGADFYYYLLDNIGAGIGINYVFDSKFVDTGYDGAKLGATNIYLSVKPVLDVNENKIIDKVYFLGQLGLGITRYDDGWCDFSQSGLYWGIGAGVEKCNVIVELLYSVNYWKHGDDGWTDKITYTNRRFAINVGYKFNI